MTLDNTHFGDASWTPYTSSNITPNLGTRPGWHAVWVGLRGLPANAQQTWNAVLLDLDFTAPKLVLSNFATEGLEPNSTRQITQPENCAARFRQGSRHPRRAAAI